MNKLLELQKRLEENARCFENLSELFVEHTQSSFLRDYFSKELLSLSRDNNYSVGGISGQLSLKLINRDLIDYTVHLRLSSAYKPNIKWMGTSQLMVIKGEGEVDTRVLRMPKDSRINSFQKGVPVEVVNTTTLKHGSFLFSKAPFEIIEIMEIRGAVIIDTLTVKDIHANLFWNFDESLFSSYPESSSLMMSRLTTILNVINSMKVPAPQNLYNFIFEQDDVSLRLRAVQTMLKEGLDDAFSKLNEFIESNDPALSSGARSIFDRLLQAEAK
jgi:hypothetical protein